ncbi:hypothetical protein TVAG_237230 [Trichomonas vaginalis G3]|uniref:Uncharacterized protein n=1 Tax=Trichomonas vaginalis (strain ATCC PRA-98 / G3) TaxID=412133 RepID=A2DCS3_TRIV3|nr:hypothetical protein TVAGG3_0607050 [Trichomonas vaginalis G3]EAY21697.1 hypothetical protein TVAG_237230 [Trichomonas vaginalis G3]KAI5524323.1 hypothetical protein TVAGG3_0607050 [Trichomonas vaginalis G3]|eukprot:XP_001582683.1 hypothetical protein [Trichomonas vaginalis G3]
MTSLSESLVNMSQRENLKQKFVDDEIRSEKRKQMFALLTAIREAKPDCLSDETDETRNRLERLENLIESLAD